MGSGSVAFHERAYYDMWYGRIPLHRFRKEVSSSVDCINELDRYLVLVY